MVDEDDRLTSVALRHLETLRFPYRSRHRFQSLSANPDVRFRITHRGPTEQLGELDNQRLAVHCDISVTGPGDGNPLCAVMPVRAVLALPLLDDHVGRPPVQSEGQNNVDLSLRFMQPVADVRLEFGRAVRRVDLEHHCRPLPRSVARRHQRAPSIVRLLAIPLGQDGGPFERLGLQREPHGLQRIADHVVEGHQRGRRRRGRQLDQKELLGCAV